MEQFIKTFESNLQASIKELYLPKVSQSHLSHLILFHLLNAATEYDIHIHTLTIRETSRRVYFINVNQRTETAITINLNPSVSCTPSLV